jgi:arginase
MTVRGGSDRRLALLGVPSSLGAHAPGQERAPGAFRRAGLVERLATAGFALDDLGDLATTRYEPDPAHPRAQHAAAVAAVARETADALAPAFSSGQPALVVGGDCTIEVGVVAGLARSTPRLGLLYVDAGPDLNTPTTIREGFLDWMGMAHLLGEPEATEELSHVGPRYPLLSPEDVLLFGTEREESTAHELRRVTELGIRTYWADDVRRDPRAAAVAALRDLEPRVDAILVHLDLDVMDFLDFPAADFPTINAGLTYDDTMACVDVFVSSPKWMGLTITEFNPDHVDEDEHLVTQFVERLVELLGHVPSSGP